jgi:hypothetical protein
MVNINFLISTIGSFLDLSKISLLAIKLLYKTTQEKIELAQVLLEKFCESYPRLYGQNNLTYNYHVISNHLIDDVKSHGSLIGHSMNSFESLFGFLLNSVHGTRGIGNQYVTSMFFTN